ncbi:PE domain-containing protein [Propionibacteriaceae bacterium Y1685]|uniref:PE domain-containing protein n=1 Tax=Microlunatus sp. Y1700 TaxID=3418487 RepID=UPI003B78F1DD
MSTQTHDPGAIREASRKVTGTATAAVATSAATAVTISVNANKWGKDEVGGAIAKAYLEPAEEVLEAVLQLPYQFGEIAKALEDTAAKYEQTEDENTSTAGDF